MRLQDKIALVTSGNIPALAPSPSDLPEKVRIASSWTKTQRAEQLAAEVRSLGRRALPLQFDVTKKPQIEEVVRRAVVEFGRIDVLLNCSALTHESDFLTFTEEAFNRCIDRGPKAYFLACQAVGQQMAEQRSGKIINLSTTDARIGSGESTGNSAAYSSIDSMTRAIAQALGFYGVNVNSLVCGPMDYSAATADEAGERLRRIPSGPIRQA